MEINQPTHIKLLFDEPIVGESKFGSYFLYACKNGDGKEYSFFAPDAVHEVLKDQKKGTEAIITKIAAQRGKKLVTTYDVQIVSTQEIGSNPPPPCAEESNPYLENMLRSFADAQVVQKKFNGANTNQLAVTMFIQRTKSNGISN